MTETVYLTAKFKIDLQYQSKDKMKIYFGATPKGVDHMGNSARVQLDINRPLTTAYIWDNLWVMNNPPLLKLSSFQI